MHQRDLPIQSSPIAYGNGTISFIPHDRAWNNRTTVMTHEVWIALIGLNLDHWNHALVDKAVSEFGGLITWEDDMTNVFIVLIRARVSGLDTIPWFFTFTEGLDPNFDCWSVQCEIFQAVMIGGLPQDEDLPPGPDDDNNGGGFNPGNFYAFGSTS